MKYIPPFQVTMSWASNQFRDNDRELMKFCVNKNVRGQSLCIQALIAFKELRRGNSKVCKFPSSKAVNAANVIQKMKYRFLFFKGAAALTKMQITPNDVTLDRKALL